MPQEQIASQHLLSGAVGNIVRFCYGYGLCAHNNIGTIKIGCENQASMVLSYFPANWVMQSVIEWMVKKVIFLFGSHEDV